MKAILALLLGAMVSGVISYHWGYVHCAQQMRIDFIASKNSESVWISKYVKVQRNRNVYDQGKRRNP